MRYLVILLLIAFLIAAWFGWQHQERLPFLRSWLSPTFTVLVLGLDEGNRADAILLFYAHPKTGLRILIVPRDTYCTGGHKINGLYKRVGARKFTELLSQVVAHPIEGYVVMPFKALPDFLNRTFPNGLTVPVPYRLRYADKAAGFAYDIPDGLQRLKGAPLAFYLRDRYSDPKRRGETARVERWKLFLAAALAELRKPENLPRLPNIATDACRTFPTNMGFKESLLLLRAVIQTNSFSIAYLPGRSVRLSRVWFVQLDKEAARRQARLARSGVVIPKDLSVWVLNGTAEPNLARLTSGKIRRHLGIPCSVGNASTAFESKTSVEYSHDVLAPLANEIAKEVKTQKVVKTKNAEVFVRPTVIVTLGHDRARNLFSGVH